MVRWLEANGYDVKYISRRRHRAARGQSGRRVDEAEGVPVRRPRRVLVGRAAGERRGGARRGRQPRVLQRQRDLLEDALRAERRRHEHAVSDARRLQGHAGRGQARSDAERDDRHVARHALRSAGRRRRPAGKRLDRPDLDRQLGHVGDHRAGLDGEPALLAEHARRGAHLAAPRRWRPTRSATSGAKTSTTASRPAGIIHLSSTTRQRRREDPRLRRDGRHRHGDAHPDALPTRQRRARLRRRHRAVGVGARRQSRPRLRLRPIRRCSRRP